MKTLATITATALSVCMLVSVGAANADHTRVLPTLYLGMNKPPDLLFHNRNAKISPLGDNHNLQQTADGQSCINGGDSGFIVATASQAIAEADAIDFSLQNPTVPFYIYTINPADGGRFAPRDDPYAAHRRNPLDHWFDFERSLRAAYAERDVYQLANAHRMLRTYIYEGALPTQRIRSARRVLNGQISPTLEFNAFYRPNTLDDINDQVYRPIDTSYVGPRNLNFVRVLDAAVLACTAAIYCTPGRSLALLSLPVSQQAESRSPSVCANFEFESEPVRDFYIRQILPTLLAAEE